MTLKSKIKKLTSIILIVLLLSAIATPVSAGATILTHKDKNNLDIPNYVLPIKDFDMKPYLTPSTGSKMNHPANVKLLKNCFKDDTCWKSLDAKTQSYVYKNILSPLNLQGLKPTDENRDSICNKLTTCNLDKKGWVGTESPTLGILHLSYDNTQPNKIFIKISYNPAKIILYDHIYTFQVNNKPNEMILINQTFSLMNLSEDERKLIDLIVNIIDTGNQNNPTSLVIAASATTAGSIVTIISCTGIIPSLGSSTPVCIISAGITAGSITSLVIDINSYNENALLINKYTEQLKAFIDDGAKDEL